MRILLLCFLLYVVWSSKISLKSFKFNFIFLTNCMHHFHSYILQKTPLKLVNWFQRYEQLKDAKNNRKQKTFFALFGSILKSIFPTSDWFCLITSHMRFLLYMIMGTQHMTSMEDQSVSNVDIILDETKLKSVDKTKFLGVTIDENLSWKNHIDGITKTISRNVGMINKLKFIIPERILRTLYCTLVLPYINYGILIWGKACKTYLEKIHKLQKRAVRIISNSHYHSHSAPLFQKHDILNVYDSYKLELGVFMYKYFNGLLLMSFNTFFTKLSDIHNYDPRNKSNYNPTRNKRIFADKAIRTMGPIL